MIYQRTKDLDRLLFLYLLTGNTETLCQILEISHMYGDIIVCYHNILLLGDSQEKFTMLEESDSLNLAYMSAKINGLEEAAEHIKVPIETT